MHAMMSLEQHVLFLKTRSKDRCVLCAALMWLLVLFVQVLEVPACSQELTKSSILYGKW